MDNIFAYLIKYPDLGITYNAITTDNLLLKAYSDSDWGSCLNSRRSTARYITTLGNNLISWWLSVQKSVALSSTEYEYIALTKCCKEIIYQNDSLTSIYNIL